MAGGALTMASVLNCPHAGAVTAIPANTRVNADALLVTADDEWVVACTNSPPCTKVKWEVTDQNVKVGGAATLSESSVGTCLTATDVAQGTVTVVSTQGRVSST